MIDASRGRGRLIITPAQDGPAPEYFTAMLTLDKLTASIHFYESRGFGLGLGDLFTSIAKDWRGWSGEKRWESIEGELALTAVHDRLGHVTLLAELRRAGDPPLQEWLVRGALVLEAGSLDSVAEAAVRFERGDQPAG